MRQYYNSNGYWIYQTDKSGDISIGLEIKNSKDLKDIKIDTVSFNTTKSSAESVSIWPQPFDKENEDNAYITFLGSHSITAGKCENSNIKEINDAKLISNGSGLTLNVSFTSKLTFTYALDGQNAIIGTTNKGAKQKLGTVTHTNRELSSSTSSKTININIKSIDSISNNRIQISFESAEVTYQDTYIDNDVAWQQSGYSTSATFNATSKIIFKGSFTAPLSIFNNNSLRTYILNNSGNDTNSTTSYTQTSGTDRFWIGLTDNSVFTSYPLDTFVKVGVEDGHGDINNICFNNKFYARNLKRKTDYAFYEIPLASVEMFQALEQIRSPSDSGLGIGTLKVKDVFSGHEILSQFEGTIDDYVNLLLTNYSEYNGISPLEGDINNGKYDSQLLAFPLPSDPNERKSLEEKIVDQYRLNGQNNLLSCKPEYNNKTINFDFLKSIFKVEDASFYDSPENPLEQLTVMSYEITHAPVEGLSMGASTGDDTFVISKDKPVSWYIAEVTAQPNGTFDSIEKAENKDLDYKALYELQYGRGAAENKLNNTKLLIKAENLTNTIDDFYYKDRIFASGGSTEVPTRTIEKQWINAQVLFDESSNECYVSLRPDSNGIIQDIIQSDGSPEDLENWSSADKFSNGAGMFDMGNSKVVTNNYKEYGLTDILSKIFLKRSDGNTSIYDLYYNNDATTIAAEDINKEKGIISFKFFLYSFGFKWKKYNNDTAECYANKLCFISEDDMSKGAGAVKYEFGITKDNIFYNDVKLSEVSTNKEFRYYTLNLSGDSPSKIESEDVKDLKTDIQNNRIGPFMKAKSVRIDNNKNYALSKNKRDDDDNTEYIYDSFRSVTAFRPFVDNSMTSELEYKNDICDAISLDKGFIHDYMLKYKDAYTVVKKFENGVETDNQLIINAGDQNTNIVFAKAVPEKDFVEKQVLTNEDLKQMGVDANQILEDIKGTINTYKDSILEAKLQYKGNDLTGLESTSTANNTYVVYKLYIDDTLDALDGEEDEKTVPPVRVDETEFTINIYPFDKDGRGNDVAGTPYIKYSTMEDVDGSITESTSSNLLYSKKFTISSAKDEVDVYDDWLNYKGIMPILLNESLSDLRDFASATDADYIAGLLADRNLSNVIFNNVKADGNVSEKQAYSAMSCMNVYSEESIKNQANYTKDVRTKDWWNISSTNDNIYPIGYNGIKLTTSSNTTQNIYIGLEPNLIEKQLAIFAQSIYDYTWYLKATNNALIEVYPNETFTFEYVIDNDSDEASIDVTHIFGGQTAVDKNTHTQHKLFTVNSTDNDEDNIGASSFEQISLDTEDEDLKEKFKEKFTRIADSSFIERAPNDTNIKAYISEKKTYHCLVLNRLNVSVSIETNGGWMLDPNAIVTKRDNDSYPISNKVYMSPDLEFVDDDLYANRDKLAEHASKINSLRKNHKLYDSTDSSMLISVNYAAPTNKKYINAINEKDKRYLGISYKLTYNVPIGVHFSEKFTGETTTVNYVNELKNITTDEWTYGDEKNGVKTIDLSAYTVNIPEKMEKTAYVFKHYFEPKYEDEDAIFNYESNKVIKRNIDIQAIFEPINYELYLSYLRDTRDTEKDVNAFDTINTELRTFTYEDTLVNFQKDDDGKITENYLARLPATKTGGTKDDCFYKGHILSDGWYMLPEKTKIKNIIIEDDEFLEKTFGPKSALCYCEPQTYNIYYIEKLPEVISSNTKIKVIQKREGVSYNESVTLLSGNEDSSIHGYNELGRYHKVLFPEPFAEPDNDDILSAADLGFANSDGTSVKYDPEEFFYGQTARNICGDFSFDEDNKTARIPNVYLEYMYEINDQSIQIKYSDNVNTIKTFNISAVEGKNAEIISFINANNDNAGLQYTNNNLNFFNTDKIFRKYKLMHLNEKNEPEQLSLMTGYFSGAPNEYTVTHNDFVQIYNLLLEDSTIYLAPIWESYKYDVEFIYNEKSTTLTLESAKKYILDIGNTTDYIFNVGDVGSSNDTIDLKNFITHFTDVTAEIYSYYVGWANTNGILRYTAGQAGLTNLVPISKNSVFDGNKKLTSDKLTLQAFFTRRMTNKNGVIFKEGDHYYCDDTKLMLINISNNGFWTIDTVFG